MLKERCSGDTTSRVLLAASVPEEAGYNRIELLSSAEMKRRRSEGSKKISAIDIFLNVAHQFGDWSRNRLVDQH
ncbi:MAG: hypothetical protein EFT35_05220 [Methanophagales archaeon ANME-1-THS]|nr:MAG: hypothetical protein EFT35_05220 [Methanophagales archaeon ANME-1-THS]